MAKVSLRRVDVQAKASLVLSLVSLVLCIGLAGLVFRNWHNDTNQIVYKAGGLFAPLFLGLAGAAGLLSVFGTALGFSSAGQRRNELQKSSWIGFFLGLGVLTSTCIFLSAYFVLGNMIKV